MLGRLLLAVGCDAYEGEGLSALAGAEQDARSVFGLLTNPGRGDYDAPRSRLLLSPTAAELRDVLASSLFGSGPADTFTFFFAGHGGVKAGSYYLCLRDTRLDRLSATGFGIGQLFAHLNEAGPRQSNVVIDACQSGGVVADLSALLKPELIGGGGTPGVTVFASAAADEYASDTAAGGRGTIELLRFVRGDAVAQTLRPALDLAHIGRLASERLGSLGFQTPVVWGLNLHGEARFCRNPHYAGGGTAPPTLPSVPFLPGSAEGELIKAHAEGIWSEYLRAGRGFSPPDFLSATAPVAAALSTEPGELANFALGLADAFAARARGADNTFAEAEALAGCLALLLPRAGGDAAEVEGAAVDIARRAMASAQAAALAAEDAIRRDRFALLSRRGGFGDLYYLPLRVVRLLGWCGAAHALADASGVPEAYDAAGHRRLVRLLLEEYVLSATAVSDEQAAHLLPFFAACARLGWAEEAEAFLGLMFNGLVGAGGYVASPDIDPRRVFEFLNRRQGKDFSGAFDLVSHPQETLAVLLLFADRLGMGGTFDLDLFRLDHLLFNVFVPERHLDFAEASIAEGTNHSFQVGHGVWQTADFTREWERTCRPAILCDASLGRAGVKVGAIASAMILPDRCPWFLAV